MDLQTQSRYDWELWLNLVLVLRGCDRLITTLTLHLWLSHEVETEDFLYWIKKNIFWSVKFVSITKTWVATYTEDANDTAIRYALELGEGQTPSELVIGELSMRVKGQGFEQIHPPRVLLGISHNTAGVEAAAFSLKLGGGCYLLIIICAA